MVGASYSYCSVDTYIDGVSSIVTSVAGLGRRPVVGTVGACRVVNPLVVSRGVDIDCFFFSCSPWTGSAMESGESEPTLRPPPNRCRMARTRLQPLGSNP
jgi:hypothetical protein